MRLSIGVTDFSWPEDLTGELAAVAVAAEDAGLDTLWVADHLLQADPNSTPDSAMLEAYTTLGFLAARTHRIGLGTMVSAVTFRPPALLIKAVTTLDVLSGGRARFGIGTGHHDGEARAMGLPFPPVGERFERLEETLRLALRMWAGDESPFEGTHHRLDRPVGNPRPLRRPRVLIGGAGERKTLRLVARYADACNVFDVPDGGRTVRHKLAVLARHCEEAGRPYGEIEKTISTRLAPGESAASFAARCAEFAEWGIGHAVVITAGPWSPAAVGTLGEAGVLLAR
ncbi:TIGR03560 family F420-dependent LLM class oxidoreductase [Amycolatopsis sp. FBCC-B4732]|uniref:TIGR03560 family F420-dependent LLM class oxidoreductase n=1 Tax=Amycolatopsis sp. FBCC-B4732 TaxID=3079339 RepID=UPI001FF4800B|nr:TIGR03560 family F420-dependent LLM class oxidoreductase [Amycolatopsis sp. FBCC-B4732]UOX91642.1 TIGR03560 family F420-dependent LLM class oxidoreductase [Amycolatopsis sp. FBCC-B4732]